MSRFKRSLLNSEKKPKMYQLIIIALIIMSTISFIYYYNSGYTYSITYSDESIAIVEDIKTFETALNRVNNEISTWYEDKNVKFMKEFTFEKVRIAKGQKESNVAQCVSAIYKSGIELTRDGAVIVIDNNEVVALSSYEEAEQVMDMVVKTYTSNLDNNEKILSYKINEEYKIVEQEVDYNKIKNVDKATSVILQGTDDFQEYTVKSGDTTWDIAVNRGVSVNEIRNANPNANLNSLHSGDVIKLTVPKPFVTVSVTKEIVNNKKIPYKTTYINDSSLYKGKTKIKESGIYGVMEVTSKITYENDVEVSRKVIKESVLKEPKDKVIAVGTKPLPPIVGTGRFIMPTSGRITAINKSGSHAGSKAIDIANSYGTSIYAADSGKVSYSAYKGGYGYCIIIDHGNGYSTLYAHLSKLGVKVGQSVSKGAYIGKMGSTGNSTGNHLHFEIRYNNARQVITKYYSGLRVGKYVVAKQ